MTPSMKKKIAALAEEKYSVMDRGEFIAGAQAHADLVKAELEAVREDLEIIARCYSDDGFDLLAIESLEVLKGLIDE